MNGFEEESELDETINFDTNIDVKQLMKSKAVREGDMEMFNKAHLLNKEECIDILGVV